MLTQVVRQPLLNKYVSGKKNEAVMTNRTADVRQTGETAPGPRETPVPAKPTAQSNVWDHVQATGVQLPSASGSEVLDASPWQAWCSVKKLPSETPFAGQRRLSRSEVLVMKPSHFVCLQRDFSDLHAGKLVLR